MLQPLEIYIYYHFYIDMKFLTDFVDALSGSTESEPNQTIVMSQPYPMPSMYGIFTYIYHTF